jgi:hypothetical protein
LSVSRVDGDFGAVAGDSEVGVLDVDGDYVAGVGAADSQALAGDHDDPVSRNLALHAHGTRWRSGLLSGGHAGSADLAALLGRDRRWQRFGEHPIVHDVDEMTVEAQHTADENVPCPGRPS